MSAYPISRAEFLASMTRAVRTRVRKIFSPSVLQCLLALVVAVASIGLAAFCWRQRDLLVGVAAFGFIVLGLLFAWELIPFSEQTRERWARDRELSRRYWSYRWRKALWFGLGWSGFRLWQAHVNHHTIDLPTLALPAAFIMAGAIAHRLWLKDRRRQAG